MAKRLLISGFEPFNGACVNPSAEVICDLSWLNLTGVTVESILLPVDYARAWNLLLEKLEHFKPDVVIELGQASGRATIDLERIAVNWRQEVGADTGSKNESTPLERTFGEKISASGPDGIFSTLPLQNILGATEREKLPVQISNSAGAYLCNFVFYKILEHYRFTSKAAGFIHLPLLPEQAATRTSATPSLSISEIKRALAVIIKAVVER